MRVLRGLAITILVAGVWFASMVVTAMAFSRGWGPTLGLLGLIWLVFLFCKLFRWELLGNLDLAAFAGYATDLLRETDRFTTPAHARVFESLPSEWVGKAGLCFYFVFVAFLPWLASRLAEKLRARSGRRVSKYLQ